MTPSHALVLVGLLLIAGLTVYVWRRYGVSEGIATLGGLLALGAAALAMLRAFKPLPPRPVPPRLPGAPLPEAEKERAAVEEHEARVADLTRAKEESPKAYRDKLTDEVAKRWKRGPDSTGGAS